MRARFNWDKVGGLDRSNVWSRVQTFSGGFSGSMILPKVGWETIVEFLDGDPDRPIVTGRVFNHEDMPPYHGPSWKLKAGDAVGTNRDGGHLILQSGSPAGTGKAGSNFIRQNAAGSPNGSIFAVESSDGSTDYLQVAGNGQVGWRGLAVGDISGNPASATTATSAASASNADRLGGAQAMSYSRTDVPTTFAVAPTFAASGAPFQVTSTTTVPNLNAQFVGGLFADQLARRDTSNTFAGTNLFKNLLLDGVVSRLSLSSSSEGPPTESMSFNFKAIETDYGTNRKGSSVKIIAGPGTGSSANGGDLALQAGAGTGSGISGSVSLSGQSVQTFLGPTREAFEMTFLDGSASVSLRLPILSAAPPRNGLSLSLEAQSGTGTDSDGGNLWLRTGSATGSGTPGKISVRGDPAQTGVSIDISPGPYTPGSGSVLKIADNNNPNPQARVFFSFDYFDGLSWRGTAQGSIAGNAATATTALNWSGALGGDVVGTQSSTMLANLQGRTLSAAAPAASQVLRYDGTQWTPGSVALGTDVAGTLSDGRLSGNVALLDGNQTFTGANAIAPAGDVSTLILRQCAAAMPTNDIIRVANKDDTVPYLRVNLNEGVVVGSGLTVKQNPAGSNTDPILLLMSDLGVGYWIFRGDGTLDVNQSSLTAHIKPFFNVRDSTGAPVFFIDGDGALHWSLPAQGGITGTAENANRLGGVPSALWTMHSDLDAEASARAAADAALQQDLASEVAARAAASAAFAQLAGNNQFAGENTFQYQSRFESIPSAAPYRPPRTTPTPSRIYASYDQGCLDPATCDGTSFYFETGNATGVDHNGGNFNFMVGEGTGTGRRGRANFLCDLAVKGAVTANSFTGNGSGLRSLNASALSSGAVPSAALPPTLAYADRTQTFSMAQNFSGGLTSTGMTTFGDHIQMALGNIDSDVMMDVWSISTDSRPNLKGTAIQLQAADGGGGDNDGGDISLAPGNSTGAGVVGKVKVTRDLAVAGSVTAGGALLANGGAFTGHVVVNGSDLNVFGGNLSVNGNICASGTIGACSDARFKEQVQPLAGALATISNLRGVHFAWKRDEFPDRHFSDQRQVGFLAQEIKEALPEVVTQNKDGFYSVDYGRLTPVLVEAIKEQQRNMDQALREKETEINALKERLAGLEKLVVTITEKLAANIP